MKRAFDYLFGQDSSSLCNTDYALENDWIPWLSLLNAGNIP